MNAFWQRLLFAAILVTVALAPSSAFALEDGEYEWKWNRVGGQTLDPADTYISVYYRPDQMSGWQPVSTQQRELMEEYEVETIPGYPNWYTHKFNYIGEGYVEGYYYKAVIEVYDDDWIPIGTTNEFVYQNP